jgi:hypothetical protein
MEQALQAELAVMRNVVRESGIPDDCKETAIWCLGQLPALYSEFRLTCESRYEEKIVRLVRCVLAELAKDKSARAEARQHPANIPERLRLFHEKFGLPRLSLKLPAAPSPRSSRSGAGR